MDAVVHLAARVHVMQDNLVDPLTAYRHTNTEATLNLARQASRSGARKFIFMSSVKVNGESTHGKPFTEQDEPHPIDPYGVSKWEAEQGLHAIAHEGDMKIATLRAPLIYGPGVRANFLALMRLVERGWPLPLAAIENRRSLLFVGNLADAIVTLLREPVGLAETFLVSDNDDVSTPELIRRIAAQMGRKTHLFAFPLGLLQLAAKITGREAQLQRLAGSLQIDSQALRMRFGWHPKLSLDQGLKETVQWYLHSGGGKDR